MTIDIEKYLTEIEPDNVCGEDLEYDPGFITFEQAVQGKEEQSMGDSVIEAEPPNWREVIKLADKLLTRTRDMRVYVNYLRALTETQGITGLANGLLLLRSAIEKYWKDIHPQLDVDDDNDPTERINILMTLCDFESFLKPLHSVPLVESKALGLFSLKDIQIANGSIAHTSEEGAELPSLAVIDGAFQDCDEDELKVLIQSASEALTNLDQMESFITEQVGINDAASFSEFRSMLKEINGVYSEQAKRLSLNEGDDVSINTDESNQSTGQSGAEKVVKTAPPGINNNQDVIKALNLISDYYRKKEPSSPIPLLLGRVVGLVGKDFMEVMQDMVPNGVEQVEFLRGPSGNNNE